MRSFAAVCAAAMFLPAQEVDEFVVQDPKPSKHVVKADPGTKVTDMHARLAEVLAMLEEADMTPAERSKARRKLLEIAEKLSRDASARATAVAERSDGRAIVRRGSGAREAIEFDVATGAKVKAKAKSKAKNKNKQDGRVGKIAELGRIQEQVLAERQAVAEQARTAKGQARIVKEDAHARAIDLRERAEALRTRVGEVEAVGQDPRRIARVRQQAEEAQAKGGGDGSVETLSKLLRAAMERRRASVEAERDEHNENVDHAQHAEAAHRQVESARRAFEQARQELKKAQAKIEAAHPDHGHGRVFGVAPKADFFGERGAELRELGTKLDRVLPDKLGKAKQKMRIAEIRQAPRGDSPDEVKRTWVVQEKADEPFSLRWIDGALIEAENVRVTLDSKVEDERAPHVRWRFLAPKADAKADAKGENIRVFFDDFAHGAADADDDDGDIREMIEALRKEMRELRSVMREVKAHIGSAAPAAPVNRLFSAPPAPPVSPAPPTPAAHPGAVHGVPGEVRSARFAPSLRSVPARVRAPRPAQHIKLAPPPAAPEPAAAPRPAVAPTWIGGIK